MRQPLSFFLNQNFPYRVTPDPDGGFFIDFPDLPGCMTQVEDASEIVAAAEEIRMLWLETAYAHDMDIPLPRANAGYSGKFVVRVPRSLHRRLAESAERDGVSLNQHVVSLLSMNEVDQCVERRLDRLERKLEDVHSRLQGEVSSAQVQEPRLELVVRNTASVTGGADGN